jgi:hypothetical protein
MLTSEILDKAADTIERNGLAKGDWYDFGVQDDSRECPVCALGAINVAGGSVPDGLLNGPRRAAALALADRLGMRDDALSYGLAVTVGRDWNDLPGRTAEQVVAELRAAAASEREAGR